jgi:hypothetical protein
VRCPQCARDYRIDGGAVREMERVSA